MNVKIYWTFAAVPGLQHLPQLDRKKIWRAVLWKSYRSWKAWAGAVTCGLFAALGTWIGMVYFPGTLASTLIGAAIGGAIGGFILSQVLIRLAIPYIREELGPNNTRHGTA